MSNLMAHMMSMMAQGNVVSFILKKNCRRVIFLKKKKNSNLQPNLSFQACG
jgi:hypothetical protein